LICRALMARLFYFYNAFIAWLKERRESMETRIAVIGIVVEEEESVELLNEILHEYRKYIIGRMGIPYPKKQVSIISIAVDAPQSIISALTGKIGKLKGVSSKTAYQGVKI
jgi:putative iron-only hydrogenase system regulator